MKIEELYIKLIKGIKHFYKDKPLKATLGLSGGLDSALVLSLLVKALGEQADIKALLMPSQFSTKHSVDDAISLAENLKVNYSIINIEPLYKQFEKSLLPVFSGTKTDVTEENIQARIRGTLLMAYSNKFGHLVLNTSNKSELAMGYGTLYGDLCGALAVLGDVYKTKAYELASFINHESELIPINIITKAPSAELRPNQKDSDSLPPYEVLDNILRLIIEENKTVEQITDMGFDEIIVKKVEKAVAGSKYKLMQIPPLIKVSENPLLPEWKCII